MEQKKDILFRNQLALASLFFFRPLTKGFIKNNNFNLDKDDKSFIEGYIKIGLFSSMLLLIYIITVISKYYILEQALGAISEVLIIIILIIIIIGIVGIFSNINIGEKILINNESSKKNVFLNYLPLFNIFSRYNTHSFDKPNLINKESIIFWSIFTISLLSGNLFLISAILIITIVKFVATIMGIELFGNKFKSKINQFFYTNPEEMRGYVSGFISYLFKNKDNKKTLKVFIDEEKNDYSKLYDTKEILHIKIQYFLLMIILVLITYFYISNISILIFVGIIISRYAIMQTNRHHLPSIPIIKEIVFLFIKLFNKFYPTK